MYVTRKKKQLVATPAIALPKELLETFHRHSSDCRIFPELAANHLHDGYKAFAVVDASETAASRGRVLAR